MSGGGRKRILDPSTHFGEVLFGLIMVLGFTGSLHVASAGREEVRTMLIAALGCNIAWGIVDGVMYLVNEDAARNRTLEGLRRVQEARTPAEAEAALDSLLPGFLTEEERAGILARLSALPPPPERAPLDRGTVLGAVAVFLLVTLTTFPVAAPFLLVGEPALALRISNGVALVMMFAAGSALGRHAGLSPFRSGVAAASTGAVLVAITTFLGG